MFILSLLKRTRLDYDRYIHLSMTEKVTHKKSHVPTITYLTLSCTLNSEIVLQTTTANNKNLKNGLQSLLKNHSTVDLNAPSLPALTFGSLISPRTANPCVHPSKYSLLYPGANLPPPRISSALADDSSENCWSTVHELMRRGTFDLAR